jgi:phosphatidylserine/phosphatidylglycerophosphate/cardiolipin synthase-like enzyme/uncharacterized membrane protein YdjX (TVP38/TMEM64 family)
VRKACILQEGRNAWRISSSSRASVIIDAADYFAAFAEAAQRARRSIFILGWDIQSNVRLWPDGADRGVPDELADFLGALARRRPELHVRLLCWEGAVIYKFEREPNEERKRRFEAHPRVDFRFSSVSPVGAARHEKIVVIDDRVAFTGGIDLARDRWDTPEHLARDPRRINPLGEAYRPFHDVHIAVDGDAARALGDYAREQWRKVTGESLDPVESDSEDPWPPSVTPDFRDVAIGISRSDPRFGGIRPVCEILTFFEDAIASARRSIFIECEYLTSAAIVDALSKRLRDRHGPEILVVAPSRASGWLEQTTMGVLRERALRRLRAEDRHGRLHLYHPTVPGLGQDYIYLHSKVLVVDDHLLHVGSANLSNRSMGVDTELDLTIEGRMEARGVRERLLAEHLGTTPDAVRRETEQRGSIVAAVEALRGGERTLVPIAADATPLLCTIVPDAVDPCYPIDLVGIVAEHAPQRAPASRVALVKTILPWVVAIAAGLAWQLTPLKQSLDLEVLDQVAVFLDETPLAPALVVGAFVAAGLVFFPLNVLIIATALLFEPPLSALYSLVGSLCSALALYGIGRALQLELIQRLLGNRFGKLRGALERHGVIAIMTLRLIPMVPFSLFNLACGGVGVRLRDYALGTFLGLLPGVLLVTSVSGAVRAFVEGGKPLTLVLIAVFLGIAVLAFYAFTRLSRTGSPGPG